MAVANRRFLLATLSAIGALFATGASAQEDAKPATPYIPQTVTVVSAAISSRGGEEIPLSQWVTLKTQNDVEPPSQVTGHTGPN